MSSPPNLPPTPFPDYPWQKEAVDLFEWRKGVLHDHSKLQKKERKMRDRLKKNFDSHHKARYLKPLDPGVCVWLPDMSTEGKIITERAPHFYIIETPSGTFQRNQRHIFPLPANRSGEESTDKSKGNSEDSIDPTQSPPSCLLDPNVT